MEIWKDIPGQEGRYQVSDAGNVRSLTRKVATRARGGQPGLRTVRGQLLKPYPSGEGYLYVNIEKRHAYISHLVLLAFIGSRPAGAESAHGDRDKTNNTLTNLRWATHAANEADKIKHGTTSRGEQNGRARLTAVKVLAVRADVGTSSEIGVRHGLSASYVRQLRTRGWGHL